MAADETEPSLAPQNHHKIATMMVGGWLSGWVGGKETTSSQRTLVFQTLVSQLDTFLHEKEK